MSTEVSPRQATAAVNISAMLRQAAASFPDRTALIQGARQITWRDLDTAVDAAAWRLDALGVQAGDAVLVHSVNCIEQITQMFAIWRVGAVLTPTNFRNSPDEVAAMAAHAGVRAVVAHRDFPEHVDAVLARVDEPLPVVLIPAAEDGSGPDGAYPEAVVGRDHPAWYFFTSGTSGRPKCAVITHAGLGFIITNGLADLMPGTTEEDPAIVLAPLSHGAATHLLRQVARGAPSVIPTGRSLDPAQVWKLVAEHRVRSMFVVPTILMMLVRGLAGQDTSSLRHVLYGGSPISQGDLGEAIGALGPVLVQYYGMAEVTGCITVLRADQHAPIRTIPSGTVSCGRVRTGMQVQIIGDEGEPAGPGQEGEICVRGPAVFAGYLDDDAANAAAFRDGWFHTGDVGVADEQGYLYLTGRRSDMYISGGSNVYPREIEEALLRHPAVLEAAVVGIPDETWGEVGAAALVLRPEIAGAADDLCEQVGGWLRERISGYKRPRLYEIWETLPRTRYDKVDKRAIARRFAAALTDATP